jgi:predicted PurR-regulated permease PerM
MPVVPTFEQKKVVSLFTVLGYLGLVCVALWLLYRLQDLIPPLLVATIIAMTLTPEVDRIERQGFMKMRIRRGGAIALIYFIFLALCSVILRLIPIVSGQMQDLITSHLPQQLLHGTSAQITELATRWMNHLHLPVVVRPPIIHQAQHLPELVGQGVQWLKDKLPDIANNLAWVLVVPIMTFFILLDFNKMLGKALILVPEGKREAILTIVTDVIAVFGNWVRGVLLVMGLDIIVVYIVLRLAGLGDYALTLAVTAGILNTIPYFGALTSTLLIGVTAWATHGVGAAVGLTVVMVVIHQIIFDNIIAPRVIGGSVHLHPLLTLLALIAGGTLFGIGGTLLAVPIAAAVQVVLVYLFPQLATDVVAVRRAASVVQATISKETEEKRPPARKEGDQPALDAAAESSRDAAESPTPVGPPVLPTSFH